MKQKQQYAALPYRYRNKTLEVLLLTSRDTGRWIIPKGWPKKRLSPHKLAMLEAFEEGGIRGKAASRPIGRYHYLKRFETKNDVQCRVSVFPMIVEEELDKWPEKDERTRKWTTPEEAATLVDEDELAEILRNFDPA